MTANHSIALECKGIGKQYRLGEQNDIFTFAEFIGDRLRTLTGHAPKHKNKNDHTFWALKDISFQLQSGTVLGLIGRNGSGKSTLLKILSRITPPTTGEFSYNGSIASLLEVGTGFKQELTGLDNIYLSGTTLGLKRKDIKQKLDQIIDFAEIGRFIHTPVKRYSSGMYVRLAFAVAAHLEPDILLIDEVLAVGDQKFQRKCLSKMSSVAGEGRTVVFVSHNMQAITQLCHQAMLLHDGICISEGAVSEVVKKYTELNQSEVQGQATFDYAPQPELKAQINRIELGPKEDCKMHYDILEPIPFRIHYDVRQAMEDLQVQISVATLDGMVVLSSRHLDTHNARSGDRLTESPTEPGSYIAHGVIPAPLLNTGFYGLTLYLTTHLEQVHDIKRDLQFEIHDLNSSFSSCIKNAPAPGITVQAIEWSLDKLPSKAKRP